MSEPMSSVEIEDVLSSIRRLVSDDLRPQARALREAQAAPQAAMPSERLVLTPALRIVPEAEPGAEEPAPETAVDHHADVAFQTVRIDDPQTDVQAAEDEAGFIAVDDAEDMVTVDLPLPDIEVYDDDGVAAPADDPVSIPDAVFAQRHAQQRSDAEDTVDRGAERSGHGWADAAEAAVRAELEQDTSANLYARFEDEPAEPAFDEAAMRDMVRDIIREELQGTLGERITRNVRKLVRAEIARAMAVRDFE